MARDLSDSTPNVAWSGGEGWSLLRHFLAQTLIIGVAERASGNRAVIREAKDLAAAVLEAQTPRAAAALERRMRDLWIALELKNEDDRAMQQGMQRVLRALLGNLADLDAGEEVLLRLIRSAEDVVARPMSPNDLGLLERTVREILFKQATVKAGIDEARDTIKRMVAELVHRAGTLADASDEYQQRAAAYHDRIAAAKDVFSVAAIAEEAAKETRNAQDVLEKAKEEVRAARQALTETQQRVVTLEDEAAQTMKHVHQDALTELLNRRGFGRAFPAETARALRRQEPLCLAAIEIDRFERLAPPAEGKSPGELAIRHVARILQGTLRPTDTVARLGGHQFVVLLSNSELRGAVRAIVRTQASLSARHFAPFGLSEQLTVSTGIAKWRNQESEGSLLSRAVKALRRAEAAGTGRVATEESD